MKTMRTALLFLTVCLLSQAIHAQKPLLPVRIDHKWRFVDHFNETPRKFSQTWYDALGDSYLRWNFYGRKTSESPYRLVERDGKVGLIDEYLRPVLDCRFKRIRPLSHVYFAVEIDSFFTVIDTAYRQLLGENRFEEVSAVDSLSKREARYFLVQKNGRWGIHENQGQLVVPPQYAEIRRAFEDEWFAVKKEAKDTVWGLINIKNEKVLPNEYYAIRVINHDFIALTWTKHGTWFVVDEHNKRRTKTTWADIKQLNKEMIAMVSPDDNTPAQMWSLSKDTFNSVPTNKRLYPAPNEFIVYSAMKKDSLDRFPKLYYGILNPTGKIVLDAVYDSLAPGGIPGLFLVKKNYAWGFFNSNGRSLKPTYSYMNSFKDSLAVVKTELGEWGIINTDGMEVIPPVFASIQIKDGIVYASKLNSEMLRYVAKTKGKLPAYDAQKGIQTFKVNKGAYYDATLPPRELALGSGSYGAGETPNFIKTPSTPLPDTSRFLTLREINVDLRDYLIYAYYYKAKPTTNNLSTSFGQIKPAFCRMTFGNGQQQIFKGLPEMIGVRWLDFLLGFPYAAFIAPDGQMGMIDKNWHELKDSTGVPYRFTYISRFQLFGKNRDVFARVCTGGRIKSGNHPLGYNCGALENILNDFVLVEPTKETVEMSDQTRKKKIYVDQVDTSVPTWGLLNLATKNFLLPPKYAYVEAFNYGDSLAVVYENNLSGAININGEWIFDIKYQKLIRFKGFFRTSVKDSRDNLYNAQGHQISNGNYRSYRGYSEALCAVKNMAGLWGFIDTGGVEVIKCQYRAVENFSEGLAAVMDSAKQWVFIHAAGDTAFHYGRKLFQVAQEKAKFFKEKFDPEKEKKLRFKDGRCLFYLPDQRLWGYLNAKGDTIIPAKFEAAAEFSNGLALVRNGLSSGKVKAAIIDTGGVMRSLPYFYMWPFNKFGVAVVCSMRNGPYGLINREGIPMCPLIYDTIMPFFDGFATVSTVNGWGLIKSDGHEAIPPKYDMMEDTLSEGLIPVRVKQRGGSERWFFVDTLGNRPFGKEAYSRASYFKGGLAEVNGNDIINRKGKKLPFTDRRLLFYSQGIFVLERKDTGTKYCSDALGNNLFDQEFTKIERAANGLIFIKETGPAAVNRRGFPVIPPKFANLIPDKDGNLRCQSQNLFGLMNNKGMVVLPNQFDKVDVFNLSIGGGKYIDIIRAELGEKVAYFREDGSEIVPLKN